jgi:hypothetical protein
MYTLVSAMGRNSSSKRWESVDLSVTTMSDFYSTYSEGFAVLTNNFFTGQVSFDLFTYRNKWLAEQRTLPALLVEIGNETIPTSTTIKKLSTKYAIYADAFRAQYKIKAVNPGVSDTVDIDPLQKTWVKMTKTGIDYNLFYKSCLVSINGFFHITDTDGTAIYVKDAMTSCRLSKKNQIGIYSLRELGELEFLPITESMIYQRTPEITYSTRMYINVGTERAGKTAMLVLGGYLHPLDSSVFTQISSTVYAINFKDYPLRERYFDSYKKIDLSSLGLNHIEQNPNQISDIELHSDSVLVKLATLSQSFIVFIDNTQLFAEREDLQPTKIVNKYTSYTEPCYPLFGAYGRLFDYWRVYEDTRWAITVVGGVQKNYVFQTVTGEGVLNGIDDGCLPYNQSNTARLNYLKLGCDFMS